jgi:hypothetical protein
MAPEQARGVRGLDGRIDVYALGIVMYVTATGTLPFTGDNTEQMLAEHASVAPIPPDELANIAPELSAIILRCLAKRPDERYPRMADLDAAVAELERRLFGGISAPPPLPAPRPRLPGVGTRSLRTTHSNAVTRLARIVRRRQDSGTTTPVGRAARGAQATDAATTVVRDVADLVAESARTDTWERDAAAGDTRTDARASGPPSAWRRAIAWLARRRWPMIAVAASTAVAFAVVVALPSARVEVAPAPPTSPVLEPAPPPRVEPLAVPHRQIRKPQPAVERDAARPGAKPSAQVAAPMSVSKPAAKPSKPTAQWDPDALFLDKH